MPEPSPGSLKRVLGPWAAVSLVIGTIIGSGIFLVPKAMINHTGSVPLVFLAWVVGGLLTVCGALTYAELGAALPHAGGEYVYLREAYSPFWGFVYGWTEMWVAKSGSIAGMATGFAYYATNFWPSLDRVFYKLNLPIGPGGGPLELSYQQLLAVALIIFLAAVNFAGVRLGGAVQVAFTAAKLGLLAAIIIAGLSSGTGQASNWTGSINTAGGLGGFFAALVAALWAYDGWNNLSMAAGDVARPQRNLPLALIAGSLLVMAIYLAASLAYFYVLPPAEVAQTDRVAAEMMRKILGGVGAAVVSSAAMISIFAALNGSILSGARIPFAMARDGCFFKNAGRIHPVFGTPATSIIMLTGWAALLVFSGRYEQLFTYVIFASWILYGMSAAAVIVLRRRRPDLARPYKTTGYPFVPAAFILGASGVVVSTLIQSPREATLGLVLIASGVPFYFRWKNRTIL